MLDYFLLGFKIAAFVILAAVGFAVVIIIIWITREKGKSKFRRNLEYRIRELRQACEIRKKKRNARRL